MQQQYDIGKRLREVMAERGGTISQLAELTDVSEDTIKAIRSGKTKSPGIQLMISIADALGCTMDGFLHRRSLTDEELYLLQKYRTLNIHGKRMVMLMADSEDHMQKKLPSADAYRAKTRRIPCISSTHTLASNSDYSTHATEFIEIPADYFPNADYCLRLTTNMLHPIYIKDDIIAVEQNFPHFGDIALFLNENGVEMIRKYTEKDGSPYLEAVSRCDRSLYLTSDIICLGTILGIVRLEDTRKPLTKSMGGFLIYKYYDVDYSAPPVISHGDGWVTNMLSLLVLDTDI